MKKMSFLTDTFLFKLKRAFCIPQVVQPVAAKIFSAPLLVCSFDIFPRSKIEQHFFSSA